MADDPIPPNYVKAWRKHRGMTQEQLAEACETDKSVISLLETGQRPLSDKWLAKLAEALGTTRGTLLDRAPGQTAEIIDFWDHADGEQRRVLLHLAESLRGYKSG